jgi:hypothetical protein
MPKIIAENDAHFAFEIVKAICADVGPGLPGSSQRNGNGCCLDDAIRSRLREFV